MEYDETVKIMVPGQMVLDRFKLVKRLGRGGMGIVWLARDQTLNLNVALKFLPDALRSDPASLDQLKYEARKSIRLTHPNIIRIHDFIEAPEAAGIAMEYIDGPTLAQLRSDKPEKVFQASELAGWTAQLCDALTYAHLDARLVHRDLKPGNLMIAKGGRLKVADFGISRSLSETMGRLTQEQGFVAGTLAYMGPQQLYGEKADPRDDIYSLGATLFDLLTGKPPFYSGDITAQIESKPPPTVTERRREFKTPGTPVPPEWEATISACLDKNPEKRPQTTAEVAARLRLSATTGNYVVVNQSGAKKPGWGRLAPWAFVIGLTALAVWLAAFVFNLLTARPDPDLAETSPGEVQASRPELATLGAYTDPLTGRSNVVAGPSAPFTNSLGMTFLPVGHALVSVYETRISEYRAFSEDTKRPILKNAVDYGPGGWRGRISWADVGYEQTDDHPVAAVGWGDAMEFCVWLTERERKSGLITTNQWYRLPTQADWSLAAGDGKYQFPWGNSWPPPEGAVNLAGEEVRDDGRWFTKDGFLEGYRDDYPRTGPVDAFPPTPLGFYFIAGNVWEWLLEVSPNKPSERLIGGASWHNANDWLFHPDLIMEGKPDQPGLGRGFRCALIEIEPDADR